VNTLASSCYLLGQAATDAAGEGAATAAVQVQSVWDFVVKGGPMMIPIGLASLAALAVIIERAVSLRRKRVIPPGFLPGLEPILQNGSGDLERARDYCQRDGSPLASIFLAGIKRLHEPVERVEKHVKEAGRREVLNLRKYLRALAVIGSITPLMGLLGTIFGMIRAFQTVASSGAALGRTELLAKGIYEAMITTAAGLLVAIPVLIAYHWIAARIDRLVMEIDAMTVAFVEEHAVGRGSRPAPREQTTEAVGAPLTAAEPTRRGAPLEAAVSGIRGT
jgi:biopolymer transport protein ExbB